MKLLWLSALAAVATLPAPTRAGAEPGPVSRYTKQLRCDDVAQGPLGQDWVYVRCNGLGGIPAWYLCQDSARCKLGFGTKPNASGVFEAASFLSWPIEWRGRRVKGRFKPFAVILRGRTAGIEGPATTLFVYRLRPDGTSCIIGEASTNSAARQIADKAANGDRCEREPELL